MKKIIALVFVISAAVSPLAAQKTEEPPVSEGFSLIEEGTKLIIRRLMSEMEPALDEMREAMAQWGSEAGTKMAKLLSQIDNMKNYEVPVILPNGDIIIRRRDDAPIYEPDYDTGAVEH